jgi:hypothetical protein
MATLHLRLSTSFHDIILSTFVPGFLLLLLDAEMFNFHQSHFLFSLRSVVRQSCDWKPVGLIRQRRSFTKNQNRSWIFNSPRESRSRRKPNSTSFQSIVFGTSFIVPAVLVYWASRTLKVEDRVSEVKKSELKSAVVAKGVGFAKPGNATSTSDNKFEYAPLDFGYKTRLLILEPGRFDEDLRCQLKHASSLKDEPKYEALSYAWGDTERTHLITCNENQLRIPANLYRALRRLRNEQDERVLWADAICIDQDNKREKGHQVQIMQEIYSGAERVIVWLGEEREDDRLAFDVLSDLNIVLSPQSLLSSTGRIGFVHGLNGSKIPDPSRVVPSSSDLEQVVNLLGRQWFRRTWVIQEVASAKDVMIQYGNKEMSWAQLVNVFMPLGDQHVSVPLVEGGAARHARESIATMETLRRSRNGPMPMPLIHVLLETCYHDCSDPRDKIFAVLGLAKDWLKEQNIKPDYKISPEEVFKDFAVWDVLYSGSLRILSCASRSQSGRGSKLPSWVPDWRDIDNTHPFIRYNDRACFSAAGKTSTVAWFSVDRKVLHVMGKLVDTVKKVGCPPAFTKATVRMEIDSDTIDRLERSRSWLEELRDMAGDPMDRNRCEELWQTMTCGLTKDGFPAPADYSEYLLKYLGFLHDLPNRFSDFLHEGTYKPPVPRDNGKPDSDLRTHALIESSLSNWSARRRFALTDSGRLACIPAGAAAGDVLCVLYGSDVPYVLRPTKGGQYIVIGECFVNDIMHGEALSNENIKSQEFQLC